MANFVFHDFETQSNADLTIVGGLKYVLDASTRPILWSWAVNDGPVQLWCPDLSTELESEVWAYVLTRMAKTGDGPDELHELFAKPDTYAVAWNSSFDRGCWQQMAAPEYGFPEIRIEQTLCAMATAQASNLPGQLEWAGRVLGLGHKTVGGKAIMKRFARRQDPLPGSPADLGALMAKGMSRERAIAAAIEAWDLYLTYSVQDTALMRDVWNCTRPLDGAEWQEYWVSERINDRGKLVDLDVARGAVQYREEEAVYIVERIKEVTDGVVTSPTLTKQINEWLYQRLPADLAETMVKARDEKTGEVTRLTGSKDVMTRILEDLNETDALVGDEVIEFLELLQYGRSSSAVKFQKMLDQEVDGRIHNAYVFNGAGQSGRFASKNIQEHNLVRDKLPNELDVLDMIASRVEIERLRRVPLSKKPLDVERAKRGETPVTLVLARCIRPTFIAPKKKVFVWGDWKAIEARINPWLAKTRDADAAVLEPFRQSDADEKAPDVYVFNAESIFHIPADVIWERYMNGDPEADGYRKAGKVAVLALGFLGGVGALKAMARNYGMRLSDEEAQVIVDGWRDRNRWARRFGDKCLEAMFSAMRHPMSMQTVGRLKYQFAPDLMGGTIACFLPDMRPIVYPMARIQKIEKFGKQVDAITYLKGMGRRSLWPGLCVENPTQGAAASLLRQTLVRLEEEEPDTTVLHTHDEVGAEVDEANEQPYREQLEEVMTRGFEWTNDLPLAAEITSDWYYHK